MNKQYFFMFSDGSYSDYSVNGLFVCDHAVTAKEWRDFYHEKILLVSKAWADFHAENEELSYSQKMALPKFAEMEKFRDDNEPEKLFQLKHGMIRLEYEELHA